MDDNYILHNGELYHWGVKGMRWGHKKGPKSKSKPKSNDELLKGLGDYELPQKDPYGSSSFM